MMVPRSYQFQRRPSQSQSPKDEKAALWLLQQSKQSAMKKQIPTSKKAASTSPVSTAEPQLTPAPTPSKPVVIPQPVNHKNNLAAAQSMRTRGNHGGRRTRLPSDHKQDAVPAAVAALLAVTSIPPRPQGTRRKRTQSAMDRRVSIDELVREWRQDDGEYSSSGVGSPLDILLEIADDGDDASIIEPSSQRDNDLMSMRSVSSDSIPSVPSLDADERSLSSWSAPCTPPYSRREKVISSPEKQDCILDHPLLHFSLDECITMDDEPTIIITPVTRPPPKPKSSFKSNLTASIQALKSAARSFSNFTAPSIPPDDMLTRSLLSPRFTSEMRPKQFSGVPTPAMRRYLNPQQHSSPPISPVELFHDTLAPLPGANLPSPTSPMIQLQTYGDSRRKSKRGNSSEAGRALSPSSSVRQREPRENGDFLRIIVMEMNMRRKGKLDAKVLGKARLWLPPRKMEAIEILPSGVVPARWVSIGVDDRA